MANKKARVIAYYLPQFHPIPENDAVWGKGFSEWINVVKAKPLFKGHIQPKIPADLGFYDLRLPEIREQQAELAREAGVEGFMYWHYWFGGGKMLLEKPFEEVLKSGKPDFPFCFGWANHSWTTKTWHGANALTNLNAGMIAEMKYLGREDNIAHFNYCLPFFKDHRYITVDGKPLFVIWAPDLFEGLEEFTALWQEMANKNGIPGIHFVAIRRNRGLTNEELFNKGMSGIVPDRMTEAKTKAVGVFRRRFNTFMSYYAGGLKLNKYDYKQIVMSMSDEEDRQENVYPIIIPGYDRTPRAGRAAVIFSNPNPYAFQKHVAQAINMVKDKEEEHKLIFLKSWNEWGEGNYMEPDQTWGHGFLDALAAEVFNKNE